jgi:antitoxin (DNA-binding transcriptional repressor) of toxin-antitoxin stability system
MTQTLSVNEVSIQTVVNLAKDGDEIVLEENGKPVARVTPITQTVMGEPEDSWDALFDAIEKNQIESEISDLAHQHDHYLYGTDKRD